MFTAPEPIMGFNILPICNCCTVIQLLFCCAITCVSTISCKWKQFFVQNLFMICISVRESRLMNILQTNEFLWKRRVDTTKNHHLQVILYNFALFSKKMIWLQGPVIPKYLLRSSVIYKGLS